MQTTAFAAKIPGELVLERVRFQPSALARALRVGPTKRTRADIARDAKRAAVVLRPGMRQSEFRRVELRMDRNDLTSLPIIVGARDKRCEIPDTPLCGLIVTGSNTVLHPGERKSLVEIVRDAAERGMPILAMSDSAPLVLAASGHEPPSEPHKAVLVSANVVALKSKRDVDHAIDMMALSPQC